MTEIVPGFWSMHSSSLRKLLFYHHFHVPQTHFSMIETEMDVIFLKFIPFLFSSHSNEISFLRVCFSSGLHAKKIIKGGVSLK